MQQKINNSQAKQIYKKIVIKILVKLNKYTKKWK